MIDRRKEADTEDGSKFLSPGALKDNLIIQRIQS